MPQPRTPVPLIRWSDPSGNQLPSDLASLAITRPHINSGLTD